MIWIFEKASECQFFKLFEFSSKIVETVAAVWTFLKKMHSIVYLELLNFLLHKFRKHFVNLYQFQGNMSRQCPFNL